MRQNPHGGDIYTKKCRVDFSVNVNPLGTPESVKEAVRKSAESVEQYPDARSPPEKSADCSAGICRV